MTGKIAQHDASSLKIKVAVGTIGVRGSIGVGETGPGGTTIINGGARVPDNHDDAAGIYAVSKGKTVNLIQPGVGTHIGPDGRMDAAHFMAGELNRIMGTLQTQIGKGTAAGRAELRGRTVSSASGHATAAGGILADDASDTLELSASADTALTDAEQLSQRNMSTVVPDGTSNWNEILTGVTSGIGSYSATGSDNCTGGLCGAGNAGTFSFSTTVNFATQDVTSATFARVTGLGQFYATLTGPVAFGSGSGNATFSYNSMSVSGTGTYTGTTGTFHDRLGTIAKDLTVNLTVLDTSGATTTGTVTGSR